MSQSSVAVARLSQSERLPGAVPEYDIVCFSIIDWEFRWQRPQQVMSRFAASGHRVFFYDISRFRDQHYEAVPLAPNVWEIRLGIPHAVDVLTGRTTTWSRSRAASRSSSSTIGSAGRVRWDSRGVRRSSPSTPTRAISIAGVTSTTSRCPTPRAPCASKAAIRRPGASAQTSRPACATASGRVNTGGPTRSPAR